MPANLLLDLPSELWGRVISFLPPNTVPCSVRLISKFFTDAFNNPEHKVVRFSQPIPRHAFTWRFGQEPAFLRSLNRKLRIKLLCLVAASGNLYNLRLAIDAVGLLFVAGVLEAAAAAGHVHICTKLRQQGWGWGSSLSAAAGAGRRDVCKWLLAQGCRTDLAAAFRAAGKGGHADLADWLLQEASKTLAGDVRCALCLAFVTEGCDLPTMQRLFTTWLQPDEEEDEELEAVAEEGGQFGRQLVDRGLPDRVEQEPIMEAAARSRTPDWRAKLEWLEGMAYPKTERCCTAAAALPDAIDRLTWLRQRGYPVDESAVASAAEAGNITALEYLLGEAGVEVEKMSSIMVVTSAAYHGHLAALQALHARGFPVDTSLVIWNAAEGGHLAVVAWLVEAVGVDVDRLSWSVMCKAAMSGSVELLAWLHERGCPLHWSIWSSAVQGGCEAALEWLAQAGCPWPDDMYFNNIVVDKCDLAAVRCLRRLGCPWGERADIFFSHAVKLGYPLAFLRWLVAEGCPVDWQHAVKAVDGRQLGDREELAAWLREKADEAGVVLLSVSGSDDGEEESGGSSYTDSDVGDIDGDGEAGGSFTGGEVGSGVGSGSTDNCKKERQPRRGQ